MPLVWEACGRPAIHIQVRCSSLVLSISRPITEQNQETRKPAAGSEGNLEYFSFANKLSSDITAAPHLFVQSLSLYRRYSGEWAFLSDALYDQCVYPEGHAA